MKSRICRGWGLGLALLSLGLAGGCLPQASSGPEVTAVAAEPAIAPATTPEDVVAGVESPAAEPADDPAAQPESVGKEAAVQVSDAPATPVSDDITVPANLRPSPAVQEIIKLANSSIGEGVLLTVVTNSTSTFNLRPEEIIYLTDIGVPGAVVTAMLQHDHILQAREPAVTDLSLVPPATASEPTPAITPAPQPLPEPSMAALPEQALPPETAEGVPQYAPISYPIPEVAAAPAEPETTPDFYDALAPYGSWVNVAGYGYCWQPNAVVVNPGWQPYCDRGRWVYSNCGWYWMSDYSWGWAPFHYGRWFPHQRLGWCWAPDRVWGPSWVCWRYSQNYCGWAALPPAAQFSAGVGLTYNGHKARPDSGFGLGAQQFHFVPTDRFTDRHVGRHVVSRDQATKIFDTTVASTSTTLRNDTVVIRGIPRERITANSRKPVPQVALQPSATGAPLASGVPFSDKVMRRPATALNAAAASHKQPGAVQPANGTTASLPASHTPFVQQRPMAVASFGSAPAPLPQSHSPQATPGGQQVSSADPASTTIVAQPQPGKAGPLILRGPNHSQQERPANTRPGRQGGNSTLVVIGSRHPTPAAGFTHSTPQPVHLPSAAQGSAQPVANPSDNIGSSAPFHQSFAVPKPVANTAPAAGAQQLPWWMSRAPTPAATRVDAPVAVPAQASAPMSVSHPSAGGSRQGHSAPSHQGQAAPKPSSASSGSKAAPAGGGSSRSQSSATRVGR